MNTYTLIPQSYPVQWAIKREPIYRLLDNEEWIINFFETGELMISCFEKFKKNPDEMQGDKEEGKAILGGNDNDGAYHYIFYETGIQSFIMSTSKCLNKLVIKDFNAKCAIKINNPTYFSLEVAKKLPFVNIGMEGECIYSDDRIHYLKKKIEEFEFFKNKNIITDPIGIESFREQTREYELFLKLKKYSHQNEYRLIWFSDKIVNDSIIIKCPEAVKYCEKIMF